MLNKLGRADYGKLIEGKLSYKDPRVVDVFKWVRELVDAGAYPKSFATLKLGRVPLLLPHQAWGADVPDGELVHRARLCRAGQGRPAGQFPSRDHGLPCHGRRCLQPVQDVECRASFGINAATKHPKLAAGMLNEMATPEMGASWLSTILLQTAIKSDACKVTGKYTAYFKELAERNKDAEYFIGLPRDHLKGSAARPSSR